MSLCQARRLKALGIISQPSLAEFDLEHPANHLVRKYVNLELSSPTHKTRS